MRRCRPSTSSATASTANGTTRYDHRICQIVRLLPDEPLASFPCGGWSAKVPGVNVSDAASYSNTAHPHPPLSANLLLSLVMKSTSLRAPGTVVFGKYWFIFGFQ